MALYFDSIACESNPWKLGRITNDFQLTDLQVESVPRYQNHVYPSA